MAISQESATTSSPSSDSQTVCKDCGKPAVKKTVFWYALAALSELALSGPDPRTPLCRNCRHASAGLMLVIGLMLLPLAIVIYLKSR